MNRPALALLAGLLMALPTAFAQENPRGTLVFVNSPAWQDAVILSHYANAKNHHYKFLVGNEELDRLLEEVYALKASTALLFERKTSGLPAISISLRSGGYRVKETAYSDHHELAKIVLEKMKPSSVVLVRDDFAFDALSSTYLARGLGTTVVFARGTASLPAGLAVSMEINGVKKVFAVGNLQESVFSQLAGFEVVKLGGRDEFEVTRAVNDYAFRLKWPGVQSIITTGDVIESTVLAAHDYPVYVVPEISIYSLPQLSELLNKTQQKAVVGVGQNVLNAGEWLKAASAVKLVLKVSKVMPPKGTAAFVRKDLVNALQGYQPPLPNYTFEVSGEATYANLLSTTESGRLTVFELVDLVSSPKPAPPVTLKAIVSNLGNAELPILVSFRIIDLQNNVVATIPVENPAIVKAGEKKSVIAFWTDPPAEGTYRVEVSAFADIYEGIRKTSQQASFDLLWRVMWINLLLIMLVLAFASLTVLYSRRLVYRETEASAVVKNITDLLEKVTQTSKQLKKK